jgi:hypothetical protein
MAPQAPRRRPSAASRRQPEALTDPTKASATFVVLHTAAAQIVNGDDEVVDPALVRFDLNREYPVTLPDGSVVLGHLRLHEGQIVIDLPLPPAMTVFAHFDMTGVRQVYVSLTAEVADLHAAPKQQRLLQ